VPFLDRLLRAGEKRLVKRLVRLAEEIDGLEPDVQALSDAQLRGKTVEFQLRHRGRWSDEVAKRLDTLIETGEHVSLETFADVLEDEGPGYERAASLDELLPEAFAVVREAAVRTIGQRPFPVQLVGGAALHMGSVAEMKTGEGKTLTSVAPVYLNALSGDGVHVVTTNDYLARRDAETMGRIHRFLGLTVGVILAEMPPPVRRAQYACDITYGTNNELGFDYLRDNMAWQGADLVQRGHNYAIVDEADSILIDEARTPLIISGPAEQSSRWYQAFAEMAPRMSGVDTTGWIPRDFTEKANELASAHYEYDHKKRTVAVTEKGVAYIEDQLGIDSLYEEANTPLVGHLANALKAQELFKRDKDYIVRDGAVLIVDEFTGRILAGRRYNEGMHQAIEAKEKVEVQAENQTLATITLQNYFRLYTKLSGMTGTAQTEAAELHQTYKLDVASIPTNRPMIRADQPDLIYKTEEAKFEAVADDIAEKHVKGQPVLVGTTSVEKSEYLSRLLVQRQIPHEVLNAKQHEREAAIVAQAGHAGAVTVATNMAGRGTDIMLGGNPDFLADLELRRRGLDPVETREEYEAAWDEALSTAKKQVAAEAEEVKEAGGLYVLGTERHESRRIDNQLRGRSGRQGDPGESRFYLSLGDDLMRRFNGDVVKSIMTRLRLPDDVPIEAGMVTKAIRSAQTQVEQQNFEIRKNVLKYDEVLNQQRTVVYEERRRVLSGEDIQDQISSMLDDVLTAYVDGETANGYAEDWDLDKLWTALGTLYPIGVRWQDLGESDDLSRESLAAAVLADGREAYTRREAEIDAILAPVGGMRELERQVLLQVMDRKWREHLYEMDYLKEGIGLRAMAQKDPLVEYQREGFDMFAQMLEGIKEETVGHLFNVKVEAVPVEAVEQAAPAEAPVEDATPTTALPVQPRPAPGPDPDATAALPKVFGGRGATPSDLSYSGPSESGGTTRTRATRAAGSGEAVGAEPGRNRPCPCGSGRKYKQCHGARV
jgi:preprotein translocase subunit SecA